MRNYINSKTKQLSCIDDKLIFTEPTKNGDSDPSEYSASGERTNPKANPYQVLLGNFLYLYSYTYLH